MKITVVDSVTREVEVEFPVYKKTSCHFYRVLSETDCVQVTDLGGYYGINTTFFSLAFSSTNEDSTEEEFNEAFERVMNILKCIEL